MEDQVGPGRPPVAEDRCQFSLVLPKAMFNRLKAIADSEGNSIAAVARRLLTKSLAATPGQAAGVGV